MQIKKLSFALIRELPIKEWAMVVFAHLPRIALYLICLNLFVHNVKNLSDIFFNFNTTVLIKYNSGNELTFPAITICSCSISTVFCSNDTTFRKMYDKLEAIKMEHSVKEILNNLSLPEESLIKSCYFVADSRRPKNRIQCKDIVPPVPSIQDGRKW